jgi:hypothetical protein
LGNSEKECQKSTALELKCSNEMKQKLYKKLATVMLSVGVKAGQLKYKCNTFSFR